MTYPTIKMKITPAPKLRGKMDVRFPANVEATAPILLDSSGGTYTFSFDADALSDELSGFQTNDQARLAALGDVPWIDPIVLSLTGRSTPTENANLIARAIKDVVFLNGDAAEHYFIGTFCNGDATFGNLLTIVKTSDGTIASQTTPHEVDRSGGITILEFGSAPRVKMAINYSQFPSTGVLLNDALSPLFIRKPPAEYVSKFFLNALDKFKAAANNPMRGEYVTAIGDSEPWGFGASGASTTSPNTGHLTDARNNFDAPSFMNKLAKWMGQKFCDGEGFSTTDPLSAAYPAGTREYRKILNVDVCYDPQFVVVNTATGLPVAKTITTEAGATIGRTLDLQPGQELHFRHVGDWWKLIFTGQSDNSSSAVRPVVTLRGINNAGSANSVTTYQASPSNKNSQNFYVTWDDWRVVIANPSNGAVCRIECIENHRAVIFINNALIGTWSGQWAPGTDNFDNGISANTTTLICQLGKNDRILDAVGSTTGPDNPTRTREGVKAIVVGTWANKPLADAILVSGSKALGTKEVTGDPATYGYSMADVSYALGDLARSLDLAYIDYYAVSSANDVPAYVSNGTTTNGSAAVTGITSTATLRNGMAVFGTGIPLGTTITVTGATTVTLSGLATASGTVSLQFGMARTADGLHENDAGNQSQYEVMADAFGGASGGKYRPSPNGPIGLGNGGTLSDQSTTRTLLNANGDRFDIVSKDGLSAIFRLALTDQFPLIKGAEMVWSRTNSITAFAGGGQTNATALTSRINRVTTVATAADSVKLPATTGGLGLWCIVINSGANSLQAFGAGTDTINGVATATGVAIAAGKVGVYFSPAAGVWFGGTLT